MRQSGSGTLSLHVDSFFMLSCYEFHSHQCRRTNKIGELKRVCYVNYST
jgi:hypothetical protein